MDAVAGSGAEPGWLEIGRAVPRLDGERVLLREWVPEDLEAFASLNADPRVMEHFPAALTRVESDAFVRERIIPQFAERGYGLWAVEVPDVAPFVGYVGLLVQTFEADFTPCVEVGWRLAFPHWGHGFATEGARAAIAFGFAEGGLDEIVSLTVPANQRSVAVITRLGMTYAGPFDHPKFPVGHRLRQHILYRLQRCHGTVRSSPVGLHHRSWGRPSGLRVRFDRRRRGSFDVS